MIATILASTPDYFQIGHAKHLRARAVGHSLYFAPHVNLETVSKVPYSNRRIVFQRAGAYYIRKGEAMADSSVIIIQIRHQYSLFRAAAPVIIRDVRRHGRMRQVLIINYYYDALAFLTG